MRIADLSTQKKRCKEMGGTMDYWVGDNKKNRGLYVDLGAVIGNLKELKSKLSVGGEE